MKPSFCFLTILVLLAAAWGTALSADTAPRMTKEQVLPLLSNPDVAIIDVREPADWEESDVKIKGALRIDPSQEISDIIDQLPGKATLILYCS